jgi:HK97 family phage portal protein
MANALSRLGQRLKSWWDTAEGSWRGPFFGQGHLGHFFPLGRLEDGFQRDLRVDRAGMESIPVIAGLRHLHRSAFAQLRPHHKRMQVDGGIEDLENSAALRTILRPNAYESGADFAARIVDEWMTAGEVAAVALRNDRFEVYELHVLPRGSWQLMIDPDTKTPFYAVGDSGALLTPMDARMLVPARDVLHLRWCTPRHPLMGESGFAAAGLAAGIQVALSASQAAFFAQMSRPSGVLSTEQQLTKDDLNRLRAAWNGQAQGMAQGGIPILGWGLKFQPLSISSEDAQVIEALRMSNEEIARCVGVPGPLVGDLREAALSNTTALIAHWLSISLGGLIERYEAALERLFGLNGRTEWVDLSTEALLRVDITKRMDALTKGVQGGVLKPNDARRQEGLSPAEGGEELFLQRQNTPVNLLAELAAAELANARRGPAAPPAISAPPASTEEDTEDAEDAEEDETPEEKLTPRKATIVRLHDVRQAKQQALIR